MRMSNSIRRLKPALLLLGLAATATLGGTAAGLANDGGSFASQAIARGYEIAPVKLNLNGLDRNLVGLGSYLANSPGGCNDCHTNPPFAPGGDPFKGQKERINIAGYLAGGTSFGPGIVSPNITPDAKRRPAGLTFDEFLKVFRTGHDPDQPKRLLQVMPWPGFGKMLTSDIRAIYQYLKAIPSIKTHHES